MEFNKLKQSFPYNPFYHLYTKNFENANQNK